MVPTVIAGVGPQTHCLATNDGCERVPSAYNEEMAPSPITLYIDADACPVKQEVYRVAERFVARGTALKVVVVANAPIAVPRADFIARVVVGGGMDEADDYIAGLAGRGDVVITADVPLAARAVKAGAAALAPNGKPFTEDAIGTALATRNLMTDLRSAGAVTSGPKPFAAQDRSRFLSALDAVLVRLVREGFGTA
jgi:uncharacterized protein YaiI (UPF0178 family)